MKLNKQQQAWLRKQGEPEISKQWMGAHHITTKTHPRRGKIPLVIHTPKRIEYDSKLLQNQIIETLMKKIGYE